MRFRLKPKTEYCSEGDVVAWISMCYIRARTRTTCRSVQESRRHATDTWASRVVGKV